MPAAPQSIQVPFTLRGRNPDVLTCIANLSNDEVFTPPELANRMLDTLAEAWAANHGGANLWADKTVKFLDPCTKSGVFLREITRRLTEGLVKEIPNLQKRVDHILTKQVFGIGITRITSLLARRSVYCSKRAMGEHSIAKSFKSDEGNIWFERMEHTWKKGKCLYCGAGQSVFDRAEALENHSYAFIHTDNIKTRVSEIFEKNMQFDVIIGNPPYQLASDGGTRDVPIYQNFIEQAKKLQPRYLAMVIPSRWMAGGLGLADFRKAMLSDPAMRHLVDFPIASEVFPGVEIKGGVCYFLWERDSQELCEVTTIRGQNVDGPVKRNIGEFDILIRESGALQILKKVMSRKESSMTEVMSARTAFGVVSNFKGYNKKPAPGDVHYYATSPTGRIKAWIPRKAATQNIASIDYWKAMITKAYGAGEGIPHQILGKPWIAEKSSICTQSFLFVCVDSREQAESVTSYYSTRFLRFLVSLRKITQDTTRDSYLWVPQQSWTKIWTDKELYKKYDITDDEVNYIESRIRPMDFSAVTADE
jgi:site-specific DNA-methyltransferase (adenine-specific)